MRTHNALDYISFIRDITMEALDSKKYSYLSDEDRKSMLIIHREMCDFAESMMGWQDTCRERK